MAAAIERDVDRVSKWSHRDVPLDAAAQKPANLAVRSDWAASSGDVSHGAMVSRVAGSPVGPERADEVRGVHEQLVGRRPPVEAAVLVLDQDVEGDVGEVDELAHAHDTAVVAKWASSWRSSAPALLVAPVTCAGSHWRTSRRVRPSGRRGTRTGTVSERLEAPRQAATHAHHAVEHPALGDVGEVDVHIRPDGRVVGEHLHEPLEAAGSDIELHLVERLHTAGRPPPGRQLLRVGEGR